MHIFSTTTTQNSGEQQKTNKVLQRLSQSHLQPASFPIKKNLAGWIKVTLHHDLAEEWIILDRTVCMEKRREGFCLFVCFCLCIICNCCNVSASMLCYINECQKKPFFQINLLVTEMQMQVAARSNTFTAPLLPLSSFYWMQFSVHACMCACVCVCLALQ